MPGRKISLITDHYYHIFNRGVNKGPIFDTTATYQRCLNQIKYYQHQYTPIRYSHLVRLKPEQRQIIWDKVLKSPKNVEIVAYCLMPNHFHLLVKQLTEGGISRFMSNFQNSYSRYFNIKTNRSGPLLTGKFQAVKIETDEQLVHVSRYIHLNPITSSLVKKISDLKKYQWSSLLEYSGKSGYQIAKPKIILNFFTSLRQHTIFLKNQIDYQRELDQLKHLYLE